MKQRTEPTADEILAINADNPQMLFPGDAVAAESEFRRLLKTWHPDRCEEPRATEVTAHLIGLHRLLASQRGANAAAHQGGVVVPWLGPLCIPDPKSRSFECADGRNRTFRIRIDRPFELGTMLVGDSFVIFIMRPDCEDLFENGRLAITSLRYADTVMEREMSKHLPQIVDYFRTTSGDLAIVIAKGADDLPMEDVCRAFDETLDPRHVAWMLSSLHNVACYLTYASLSHNAISPSTCFVSPRRHTVSLLGGWWYSTPHGRRLIALPEWTMRNVPRELVDARIGNPSIDLSLLRAVGLHLLGPRGLEKAPAAMRRFLESPVAADALTIYRDWMEKTLRESFGARRFVDLGLDTDQIYDKR